MAEMMVNVKVARKKVWRATLIHCSGFISSNSTKNTAATWEKVLALPKTLGRKSRNPAIANNTVLAARMEMSRLKTTTVYFQGILCKIESTRKTVLSNILSA